MHKRRQLPEDDTSRQPVESFYYGVCPRNPSTLWIIHWRWKSNHLKHARWTASNVQSYIVRIIFLKSHDRKMWSLLSKEFTNHFVEFNFLWESQIGFLMEVMFVLEKVPCLSDIESCKGFQSRKTIIWRSGCKWLPARYMFLLSAIYQSLQECNETQSFSIEFCGCFIFKYFFLVLSLLVLDLRCSSCRPCTCFFLSWFHKDAETTTLVFTGSKCEHWIRLVDDLTLHFCGRMKNSSTRDTHILSLGFVNMPYLWKDLWLWD